MAVERSELQQVMREAVAPRPKVARPIVLIGAGGIAHDAHLPAYAKAGFPVAAVVDLNQEKAQALAGKFGIPKVVGTIGEAVGYAPKDAVFDCAVPAPAHGVLEQLPDGAAVLLQKPMGETLAEAEEILAICRRKGLTAAINFQLRFAPNMLAARALYGTGVLGELHDMEVKVSCLHAVGAVEFIHTCSAAGDSVSLDPLCGSGAVLVWESAGGLCEDGEESAHGEDGGDEERDHDGLWGEEAGVYYHQP